MKKKQLTKKFDLNKKNIANLDQESLKAVLGGNKGTGTMLSCFEGPGSPTVTC